MSEEKDFELEIDEANLSKELATQSSKFCYVAEQSVTASLNYDNFSFKVDQLYATLDAKVRQAANESGEKLTEKKIEQAIITNKSYIEAVEHLNRLRAHREIMKVRREAFKDRGSMLIQIASTKRAEMDTIGFDTIKLAAEVG